MPSLVNGRSMNSSYDFGPNRMNGALSDGFDNYNYREDIYGGRDDMRRAEEDPYRRGARNGGPTFDRFPNTDYLDQNSLSDFRSNEPKFELDHLATFAAGSRNGCINAEDGLRKLRQMENTTGIWTMRTVLLVERNCLVILDNSTQEELERFPVHLVHDPTAIFKNDRREIYNNLILFTIVDDPKKRTSAADMHIFQSCKAPAQEIVDEILSSQAGQQRVYPAGGGRIPPPPVVPAPEPPNAYDFNGMRDFFNNGQFGGPGQQRSLLTRISSLREKEDIDGGSNEILERDVHLLNHCFDDIEKFVARLQQAAESYKELEKRKKERGAKNKKRQSGGDGMLNARARPPPDSDFIDIFQKFKLSFNLLAKLKAHIHDPNAPELVHFLFTPMSLIFEASRDPYHGNQNLSDQAVAPVLTPEAKQLLLNCLSSKEVELWQQLGKHWTTSRAEWNGHIPPYVPEFYDGWQPAASVVDEMSQRTAAISGPPMIPPMPDTGRTSIYTQSPRPMAFPEDEPLGRSYQRESDYMQHRGHQRPEAPPLPIMEPKHTHIPPAPMVPMSREEENNVYFDELKNKPGVLIYEAGHDRSGKNAKELTVMKGDVLEVIENNKNWWKLCNYKREVGFCPYTILKALRTEDDAVPNGHHPFPENGHDDRRNVSRRDTELPLQRHAHFRHQRNDSRGSDSSLFNLTNSPDVNSRRRRDSSPEPRLMRLQSEASPSRLLQRPPSPPSAPSPPRMRKQGATINLNDVGRTLEKAHRSSEDLYQDELFSRVSSRQQTPARQLHSDVTLKLTVDSTDDEVTEWLKIKAFSEKTQKALSGWSGLDMFQVQLAQLNRLAGHDEAIRLDGMIRLQKNKSGYATRSSKELNAILQKRKEHVNNSNELIGSNSLNSSSDDDRRMSLKDQLQWQRSKLRTSDTDLELY